MLRERTLGVIKAVSLAIGVFTILSLLWQFQLYYTDSSITVKPTSLYSHSGKRHGRRPFDIVLAHYKETPSEVKTAVTIIKNIPSIVHLNPRIIIYTKGEEALSNHSSFIGLKEQLGADILYTLPNVGREGDTYLTHIIEHYDELADHTMFLQGGVEFMEQIQAIVLMHFRPTLGIMSFGFYSECSSDACFPLIYSNPDPVLGFKRLPQLYTLFNEDFCPQKFLISFKGQFLVSRSRITRNAKHKWELVREALINMSHFVHDDPIEETEFGLTKDASNPTFGHTIERAWMIMFGCNDLRIKDHCHTRDISAVCGCYDE